MASATTAADSMLEMRFPNRSTATITPSMPPSARGPVAGHPAWLMVVTSGPRSRGSQRPAAIAAASGANTSRPWNVALTSLTPNLTRRVLSTWIDTIDLAARGQRR